MARKKAVSTYFADSKKRALILVEEVHNQIEKLKPNLIRAEHVDLLDFVSQELQGVRDEMTRESLK